MRLLAVTSCALLAALNTVAAQTPWRQPQPPCDLKAGHFRVSTAVSNLKLAAEKPQQRDRMLSQTLDVLTRTITGDGQDKNPAAWYWFGRYYVEMGDVAGADSAFTHVLALAPQCGDEIATYRRAMWETTVTAGEQVADAGNVDSAAVLLRRAAKLLPTNPRPLFLLGQLYARHDRNDSATVYLKRAADAARSDTAYAAARKDALETVARIALRNAHGEPNVQKWARTRFSRDAIDRLLIADSTILARIVASSQSRKTRNARLAPPDQAAFSRDSTAREQAVARDRTGQAGIKAQAAAADSAGAQAPIATAIQAVRDYLTAFPDVADAASGLATAYAQSGRTEEGRTTLMSIFSGQDARVRLEAGVRTVRAGLPGAGAALLESGLKDSPYDHDALTELANAYRVQRDGERMLGAARRLLDIDPLSGTALRLVGTAWELRGGADSAKKYLGANDTLKVEISVGSFVSDGERYTLSGVAGNRQSAASQPMSLTFEFFNASGAVVATNKVEIPTMTAAGSHDFAITVPGKDLRGWRYRLS